MRKIYILLSRTDTVLARTIHSATHTEYTHASLSLDNEFEEMYTFGRRKAENPFIGGFVKESLHTGVLKKFDYCPCVIYSLEVTDEQVDKIKEFMAPMMASPLTYKYNILGLFSCWFNISWHRKQRYVCSQFVASALEYAKVDIVLPREPIAMRPNDFRQAKGLNLVYEGSLKDIPLPIED